MDDLSKLKQDPSSADQFTPETVVNLLREVVGNLSLTDSVLFENQVIDIRNIIRYLRSRCHPSKEKSGLKLQTVSQPSSSPPPPPKTTHRSSDNIFLNGGATDLIKTILTLVEATRNINK